MKEEHFHLRVDATDKALVRCAAKEAGVSASRFILEAGRSGGGGGGRAAEPVRGPGGAVG